MDTYEKKYKESLELARDYYKANLKLDKEDENLILEDIFPELKESEDERIRKRIIHALHGDVLDMEETNKAIAWLEKQGESTDINPSEFDLRLNKLLKQFETLSKEELVSSLSFYLNVVQNDGTYKADKKQSDSELKDDEDEMIRQELITFVKGSIQDEESEQRKAYLVWLEKQGEQKLTQETEPFEAEHGKYYYCIKDYFYGGKKQALKGDVVQALRGLPIMGLKDASEYFLPVNFIKCNSAWSEEDESRMENLCHFLEEYGNQYYGHLTLQGTISWLKSLKPQPKQEWSEEDEKMLHNIENCVHQCVIVIGTVNKVRYIDWLKSLKQRIGG